MANGRQSKARRLSMAERAAQQMSLHFPDAPAAFLWHRNTNDGYTTVPRTLPIAMQAIDAQTKGQPAGHTLFCLWARSPDHPLLMIENPATYACEAGFNGERAVDTWRRRMKELQSLGFLANKPGASGDFHYVLLLNPNVAIQTMHDRGQIQTAIYSRFLDRLTDIGGMGDIEEFRDWQAAEVAKQTAPAPLVAPPPPLKKIKKSQ